MPRSNFLGSKTFKRDPKIQKDFFVTQQLPGIQNLNRDPKIQNVFFWDTTTTTGRTRDFLDAKVGKLCLSDQQSSST